MFEKEATAGSSPLARGLRPARRGRPGSRRIIPARAGFTSPFCSCNESRRDHPRSRGVYSQRCSTAMTASGSSPLARGLPAAHQQRAVVRGIIPARAGFTEPRAGVPQRLRDHPRSRGVYNSQNWHAAFPKGSSPLARGLHSPPENGHSGSRIIPARAGFTLPNSVPVFCDRDHPRSRGVY